MRDQKIGDPTFYSPYGEASGFWIFYMEDFAMVEDLTVNSTRCAGQQSCRHRASGRA